MNLAWLPSFSLTHYPFLYKAKLLIMFNSYIIILENRRKKKKTILKVEDIYKLFWAVMYLAEQKSEKIDEK